jgi:hypothetical protein
MARGRMLSKSVSLSMKMQALPDDTCRLLATWTIAHLDKRGVFYGDPVIVKSLILPMRSDVTTQQVQTYLAAMEQAGLILTFEDSGRRWQCWPGFAAHQVGLRDEREATEFPAPRQQPAAQAPEAGPTVAGSLPEACRHDAGEKPVEVKGEVKGEEEGKEKTSDAIASTAPSAPPPASTPPAEPEAEKSDRPRDLLFDAIAEVTASNVKLLGSRIAKCAKELRKIEATPDQVHQVARWFAGNDWRGKKGEKLTFATLIEIWDAGIANRSPPPASGNGNGRHPPEGETAGTQAIRMILEKANAKPV